MRMIMTPMLLQVQECTVCGQIINEDGLVAASRVIPAAKRSDVVLFALMACPSCGTALPGDIDDDEKREIASRFRKLNDDSNQD